MPLKFQYLSCYLNEDLTYIKLQDYLDTYSSYLLLQEVCIMLINNILVAQFKIEVLKEKGEHCHYNSTSINQVSQLLSNNDNHIQKVLKNENA